MKTKTLYYFLQLARFENISQTADFLNISQPALSKQIRLLEEELQSPLFDRFGNKLKLNAIGRQYSIYARQALQLLDIGKCFTTSMKYEISGNLSVTCFTPVSVLLPCISSYSELNPHVHFNLYQYTTDTDTMNFDDWDFILYASFDQAPLKNGTWETQEMYSEKIFTLIAPTHPMYKEFRHSGNVHSLSDSAFITPLNKGILMSDPTLQICRNYGFTPRSICQTNDLFMKIQLIAQGLAVGFVSEGDLGKALAIAPALEAFPVPDYSNNVYLVHKGHHLMSEVAADFLQYLENYIHD